MADLNVRANTFLATTGTTWSATASAVDGAYGVNSATYSVWTNTTANAVGTIDVGFGTQLSTGLATATALTSVQVSLRSLVSQATRITAVTVQAFDGSTAIGSPAAATISVTAHNDVVTITPTLAQVKSATFKIRVSATRFNGTQAGTFSIDYADLAVVYAIPGGKPKVRVGGAWVDKPVKVRIGGAWVEKPMKVRDAGAWELV